MMHIYLVEKSTSPDKKKMICITFWQCKNGKNDLTWVWIHHIIGYSKYRWRLLWQHIHVNEGTNIFSIDVTWWMYLQIDRITRFNRNISSDTIVHIFISCLWLLTRPTNNELLDSEYTWLSGIAAWQSSTSHDFNPSCTHNFNPLFLALPSSLHC